jgi:Kef-type K+ transport system membrane component KefB
VSLSTQLEFFGLLFLFGILIVPKILQRYQVPAPLTCFVFGVVATVYLPELQLHQTLTLLAALGISSLFLFAGLEVRLSELRKCMGPILGHLFIQSLLLAAVTSGAMLWAKLSWQAGLLLALALLTPSTGFILEYLRRWGVDEHEAFWIKSKAISSELLALAILFLAMQSTTIDILAISLAVLWLMLVMLPLLFLLFVRLILPYAPGSEFSFLVLMGLIAAYITKHLGVYYLVGAFLVGFLAQQLRKRMPTLVGEDLMNAVRLFASFFIPFYFFRSGLSVPPEALNWESLWLGVTASMILLPLRIGIIWLQREPIIKEHWRNRLRISISLTPTLIFTLVLAAILRETYKLPDTLYSALLIYAMINTALPSFILPKPVDNGPATPLSW